MFGHVSKKLEKLYKIMLERIYSGSAVPFAEAARYMGVHQTHCCAKHGCKYGEVDCPVVAGIIKQSYPCESCDNENNKEKDMYNTKTLTKDDVKRVFLKELEDTSEATTLDVKLTLRDEGFFARQTEVSLMMDEISVEECIPWKTENGHRVYGHTTTVGTVRSYPQLPVPPAVQNTTTYFTGTTPQKKKRVPAHPAALLPIVGVPSKGDWQVTDENHPFDDPFYFIGTLTRGQAKYAGYRNSGYQYAKYVDMRTKRIK
jgi:hypothetical protein